MNSKASSTASYLVCNFSDLVGLCCDLLFYFFVITLGHLISAINPGLLICVCHCIDRVFSVGVLGCIDKVFSVGVLGCPRTCLHSIITVLSRGVDARSGLTCLYYTPKLAELAYHMIYVLCSNQHTYGPTLRYLRMHDFFHRQAQHLPFQPKSFGLFLSFFYLCKICKILT